MLSALPGDLPVELAMNQEYQCELAAEMVVVEELDGRRYVCFNDQPDYRFVVDLRKMGVE
jgi:hypothetical protein